MAGKAVTSTLSKGIGTGKLLSWLLGLLCFGLLVFLLLQVIIQFMTPPPVSHVQLLKDVPLPGVSASRDGQSLLGSVHFDRFDFQALDPQTGLLFIAHDGPSANKLSFAKAELPAGASIRPGIVIFDVRHNKYVASINGPSVHGITIASDSHKIYAAGFDASVIDVIDEQACQAAIGAGRGTCAIAKTIKTTQNPDSLEYDADHHEVFISEANKATPSKSFVDVIDTQTDSVVTTISIPAVVGHVRYDAFLHRFFIAVATHARSEVDAIDPVANLVSAHIPLPSPCSNAHGLAIDESQQVAFVACVDSHNLAVVDLRTMKAIGDPNHLPSLALNPDVVAIDHSLHVLFVGCATGLSVFDESRASSGSLTKFGDYTISTASSHSIAVDDSGHNIYIPLPDVGNRPIMRIEHYDQHGVV